MRKFIKKITLWICSAVMFVSIAGLCGIFAVQTAKANAAEAWTTEGVFEMQNGASLRLSEENGLRFVVAMDETVANFIKDNDDVEFGFVMAPRDLMEKAIGRYLRMPKKIGGPADKAKIYQEGEMYYANGCITNVKTENIEIDFVAIAYIQQGETVRYTEYNALARNNLYNTVNMAVLGGYAKEVFDFETYTGTDDPTDDNTGWYGSEIYPIVVENTTEYTAVVESVNDGLDLSNYTMVVKNDATPNFNFNDSEKAPDIISEQLDKVIKLIDGLPSSITMPDAIGMIHRIRAVEKEYNLLSDADKASVENYAKLESLLASIAGYDRVYYNEANDGTVISNYVPNYSDVIGGKASTYEDEVYGNVLKVISNSDGRAALHYQNFPDVSKYDKIYFYVKINVGCDIYLSDGIANDGWGIDYKNTWSVSGYWCNADTWRLIEIDVASGYIGTDFALGFRTNTTDYIFEVSDIYGHVNTETHAKTEAGLTFGTLTDSGTTNEYGTVYNISREQWYIDNNNNNTIGTLQASKLANALPAGYEYFYFWMYNGTGTEYNFHLAGDVSGTWTDSQDSTALKVGEWTKVTISAADIELNKNGQWYVYILGGDGAGAAKDGWQISTIYAGVDKVVDTTYTDHKDVKAVIALIDALPDTLTLEDVEAIATATAAYDALTEYQKTLVTNVAELTAAQAFVADHEKADEVIALIDAINPRNVDETLVEEARAAYNALTDTQKSYVTNLATLEGYEAEIEEANQLLVPVNNVNTMIANLPDEVVMPDHLVFVSRIEAARDAYEALSAEGKGMVTDYAKLRNLLTMIKGYTTVYRQSTSGVNVIPSHVPNYTSTIGGTASMGYDSYYGDYLQVTAASGGKAAIQFISFPAVSQYATLYFNIRVVGESCDIYLSDGITNDGWGENWHNTWSMSGFWANDGNWIQKEVAVSTGIFTSNWALGLRAQSTDVSFEITDIIGWAPELGTDGGLTFGNFTDSGETNEYGTVYNLTQGWGDDYAFGAFNPNALKNALGSGHDSLHFWMYNPTSSESTFYFNENESWTRRDVQALAPNAWTEVTITPDLIAVNVDVLQYVCVSSGVKETGWKVSPIYSFSSSSMSQDAVSNVQRRIDALGTANIIEEKVTLARDAYEALSETEKEYIVIDKLITCEATLYGDVTNAPFIVNGETMYKMYIDVSGDVTGDAIKEATAFVNEHLKAVTGVSLQRVMAEPARMTKYCYAIVFGYPALYEALGFEMPSAETLGSSGYVIAKCGRTFFIVANGADGYRMGALAFLRETLGYEMFAEDCIVYAKDGTVLPEVDKVEVPSFEYRQQQPYMTEEEVYGMGLHAHTDIWIASAEGWDMHNVLHYLPVETYGTSHANWYTSDKTQICPTAGGTKAEFEAMVDVIATNMLTRINLFPALENINFSIVDSAGDDACTCARCQLYTALYGEGGFSAAWIDLMNAINAKIRPQLGGRKLNISFLAYRSTETAPANDDYTLKNRYEINDDGSYTQTNEPLKCDEGVAVWLAPIDALYAENFNHADNATHLATIKKWCALSDNVYLWMYGANFKFYMYPYNTWKASAENYKILADLGVKAVWSQSNETEATAFSDLKGYIDSKFMFNVNVDYEAVLNSYFTNYYGSASAKMRALFDKIVAKCEEIESNYDGLGRGIYDNIENASGFLGIGSKTYWSQSWLEECVTLCDEAKALIDADGTLTDAQKTAIKNRITKESLFPRYVLCTTFASKYSTSNKKSMRQAFKADCEALGVTLYREADGLLSDLYEGWGV